MLRPNDGGSKLTQTLTENLENPTWRDFLEMCKPRVVLLMLLCSSVGMLLASEAFVGVDILVLGNLGIALVAGSAAALNHLIDSRIDARMDRTKDRPVAQGRVRPLQGGLFVGVTGTLGIAILALYINPLTAWLNFGSWLGYGVIYSIFLKRLTPQNIVIGGLFGAAPPLFGWTAVTGSIDGGGLILVLIIFAWTPPHFWALAIDRKEEYRKVNVPMLPVTHGEEYTKLHILLYTLILLVCSVLPYVIGMSNLFYLSSAVALGAGFVYWSLLMIFSQKPNVPFDTFRYSIFYLAALFVALLLDHYFFPVTYMVG